MFGKIIFVKKGTELNNRCVNSVGIFNREEKKMFFQSQRTEASFSGMMGLQS